MPLLALHPANPATETITIGNGDKADLKWASFKTLEQLQTKVDQLLAELTSEVIASITGCSLILDALSVVNTI